MRFQAHAASVDAGSNEDACQVLGDEVLGAVVQAIETGLRDGSMRPDVGEPKLFAVTLWAFTHGVIQLAMTKGNELARFGIATTDLSNYAFGLIRAVAQNAPAAPSG